MLLIKNNKINNDKLLIIDCVSKQSGNKNISHKCIPTTNGPQSLTEISLVINDLINKTKSDIVIFDSLSTLLIYNNLETTQKFLQYIINRVHNDNITGIIISINDEKCCVA